MRARHLLPRDLPDIIELGRLMHEECHGSVPFVEAAVCEQFMNYYLNGGKSYDCLVVETLGGRVVGMITYTATPYLFNKDHKIVQHQLLFVHPEYRTGRAVITLLAELVSEAIQRHNAVEVYLGVNNDDLARAEEISHLFTKAGFAHVGFVHRRVL